MDWSAQIPDLNTIENVRKIIGEEAQMRNPPNLNYYFLFIGEIMKKISHFTKKKNLSIFSRIDAVM